jgi:hypothetical protein
MTDFAVRPDFLCQLDEVFDREDASSKPLEVEGREGKNRALEERAVKRRKK